jgi:hypothetical protein
MKLIPQMFNIAELDDCPTFIIISKNNRIRIKSSLINILAGIVDTVGKLEEATKYMRNRLILVLFSCRL